MIIYMYLIKDAKVNALTINNKLWITKIAEKEMEVIV